MKLEIECWNLDDSDYLKTCESARDSVLEVAKGLDLKYDEESEVVTVGIYGDSISVLEEGLRRFYSIAQPKGNKYLLDDQWIVLRATGRI